MKKLFTILMILIVGAAKGQTLDDSTKVWRILDDSTAVYYADTIHGTLKMATYWQKIDTIKVQFLLSTNNNGTEPFMQISTFVRNGYVISKWNEPYRYLDYFFQPLPVDEVIWNWQPVDWIDNKPTYHR